MAQQQDQVLAEPCTGDRFGQAHVQRCQRKSQEQVQVQLDLHAKLSHQGLTGMPKAAKPFWGSGADPKSRAKEPCWARGWSNMRMMSLAVCFKGTGLPASPVLSEAAAWGSPAEPAGSMLWISGISHKGFKSLACKGCKRLWGRVYELQRHDCRFLLPQSARPLPALSFLGV